MPASNFSKPTSQGMLATHIQPWQILDTKHHIAMTHT